MRLFGISLIVAGLVTGLLSPAAAQDGMTEAQHKQQYDACMVLVDQDPAAALESALEWERQNGGDAAKHCQALALIGLARYDDAALLLEDIAQTLPQVKAPLAAQTFAQAAYAWRLAGKEQLALHDLNEGLKLTPQDVDLLVDRALLYGESSMLFEALDDLNAASDLVPDRADIYVYRASIYIDLKEPELAEDNVVAALALAPDFPDALLQRARLRASEGDADSARADIMKILEIAPRSPPADAAQRLLEDLDIKAD